MSEHITRERAIGEARQLSREGFSEIAMTLRALATERDALAAEVAQLRARLAACEKQEPVFWYRPRSDGGYERPIHNNEIEQVRKDSGAWVALYADPVAAREPDGWISSERIGGAVITTIKPTAGAPREVYVGTPPAVPQVPEGMWLAPWNIDRQAEDALIDAAREYMQRTGGNNPDVMLQAYRDSWLARHPECAPKEKGE